MAKRAGKKPNVLHTPLNTAALNGDLDIVQYLVGKGAEIDKLDNRGWTPLFCASRNGHLEVVQYLVGQGACVERDNNSGRTPLHTASHYGHLNVVQYLVGQGAKVENNGNDGPNPLHCASRNGHLKVVQYLVGQGAQINKVDRLSRTPLHLAQYNGHLEVVQYLVDQGKQPEGASALTNSTSAGEKGKRKATEEKDAPNHETGKNEPSTTTRGVIMNLNASDSATVRDNRMIGQEICKMIIASQDIITNVVLIPGVFIHRAEDRPMSWDLTSLVAESRSRENRAGDHAVFDLLVIMHLERLSNHYIYTIILPVTLINAIGIRTFFIPLKSGERLTTCISVVFGVTVFQIVIIEVMPQTTRSGAIPPTIKYLTMTFINLAVIMMCSAVSLNITYQKRRIKNRFLRILFFRIFATMVLKRQDGLRKMTERNVQSAKSDGQDLNRPNNFSICEETRDNTPQVIESRGNHPAHQVSEENDMELVAIIIDRIFLCTFLVIEICMIFMFRATFSDEA